MLSTHKIPVLITKTYITDMVSNLSGSVNLKDIDKRS